MSTLDQDLRARDPDRWLSSRFVGDAEARARLVALYTLDGEWARVAGVVSTPIAGEIRFAWWAEALERFAAGASAEHPALGALGRETTTALKPWLLAAIDARHADLDGPSANLKAEAAIITAAAVLLDPAVQPESVQAAAEVWASRTAGELAAVNAALRVIPVKAFPAVAHATLVRAYAVGGSPGELEKRARITWAVLRGRL